MDNDEILRPWPHHDVRKGVYVTIYAARRPARRPVVSKAAEPSGDHRKSPRTKVCAGRVEEVTGEHFVVGGIRFAWGDVKSEIYQIEVARPGRLR